MRNPSGRPLNQSMFARRTQGFVLCGRNDKDEVVRGIGTRVGLRLNQSGFTYWARDTPPNPQPTSRPRVSRKKARMRW
jgi:hypothetical protein